MQVSVLKVPSARSTKGTLSLIFSQPSVHPLDYQPQTIMDIFFSIKQAQSRTPSKYPSETTARVHSKLTLFTYQEQNNYYLLKPKYLRNDISSVHFYLFKRIVCTWEQIILPSSSVKDNTYMFPITMTYFQSITYVIRLLKCNGKHTSRSIQIIGKGQEHRV